MNFSEKIMYLRKVNHLTQEQLAEKMDVSRQSISKWETEQAIPEVDKLVALSKIFNVTIDYMVKPSEVEELTVKTNIIEKQQKEILIIEEKRSLRMKYFLICLPVYCIFIAIYYIGHFYFEIWNPSVIFAEFLIATAIAILLCNKKRKGE